MGIVEILILLGIGIAVAFIWMSLIRGSVQGGG
jgi:hypothetical protein